MFSTVVDSSRAVTRSRKVGGGNVVREVMAK